MEVWIDAQLPPALATLLRRAFGVEARHVLDLGLVNSSDEAIYLAARQAEAIVITKESDIIRLQVRDRPPPKKLWLTVGNVSNAELWQVLERNWARVVAQFDGGEPLVEIGSAH